ncbi:MAG TPA: phenylalanine--tRNA ligase subunit beta [Ignavibacteriales bacterium]|nr:phenylalanine--tRNA ligase subunit beta [Ignavibacteriales bacterium]
MKILLSWLKNYVDLKGISPEEISVKLTMAGLEVEDTYSEREVYKGFIVGLVKAKQKHPNADKLSLCTVSDGEKDYQVICGAPNVQENQKIVFAPIGTVIPKGQFKIEKAKIRGVESFGMICSEAELNISDYHEGIMVLPDAMKAGVPITEALKLNDVVFEIGITPNRPDALSHIGVARELAALYNKSLSHPKIKLKESKNSVNKFASIEVEDEINCPRYSSLVVRKVEIKESPQWLKDSLTKIGLRPISNVVDITNYVMHETGQPLHAFDLDLLAGNKIIVKSTKEESVFTTLDWKQRNLPIGTMMICDAEKPVAIAGVMGGANSEINYSTKNLLIESAYFNPSSIRRASRALGLSTDASYRFERGTDPNNTLYAAQRAAQLISEICNGEVASGNFDVYPKKIFPIEIVLRYKTVERILGYEIDDQRIGEILKSLGIYPKEQNKEEIKVAVPTFRPDIEREIDLIEEIARIHGYDNIPTISKIAVTLHGRVDESEFADQVRDIANSLGFFEMINNPLVSEKLVSYRENPIQILNPQNIDMEFLRNSLLPTALSVISRNINSGEKDLCLFEIGNIFYKNSTEEIKSFGDFTESQKLIFIMTGRANNKEWYSNERFFDFFDLKGLINSFLSKISLDNFLNDSYYHSGNKIYEFLLTKSLVNKVLGEGGKVKKEVLSEFGIDQDVYSFEFDLQSLMKIERIDKKFIEPGKFPKIFRDFAFIFDNSILSEEILVHIRSEGSVLLKSVKLFDLFEGESVGKDKKSLAFSLEYGSEDRTLTEVEVEKDFTALIKSVTQKFNATLRGK